MVTFSPLYSTIPESVLPKTGLLGDRKPMKKPMGNLKNHGTFLVLILTSPEFTVVAFIFISISFGFGWGLSMFFILRTLGGPNYSKTAAFMLN